MHTVRAGARVCVCVCACVRVCVRTDGRSKKVGTNECMLNTSHTHVSAKVVQ